MKTAKESTSGLKLRQWSPSWWVFCWLYNYYCGTSTNKIFVGIVKASSVFSGVTHDICLYCCHNPVSCVILRCEPTSWLPQSLFVVLLRRIGWKRVSLDRKMLSQRGSEHPTCMPNSQHLPTRSPGTWRFPECGCEAASSLKEIRREKHQTWMVFMDTCCVHVLWMQLFQN